MKTKNEILRGTGNYAIVIILIVSTIAFIDFRLALFVGVFCVSILVIRNIIGTLNPGHVIGYRILKNGGEMSVPKRVEVFDLIDSSSTDKLYKYVNIVRSMAIPPRIIIIRFQKSFEITSEKIIVLDIVEKILSGDNIEIIFSEIDNRIKYQLKKMDLIKNVANSNICNNIDDALTRAKEILKIT